MCRSVKTPVRGIIFVMFVCETEREGITLKTKVREPGRSERERVRYDCE